jgi:predicted HicB family RNase H-like nuclease
MKERWQVSVDGWNSRSDAMNLMTVDNHHAKIEYDADLDMFRGEILGLNGGADFYGHTPDELRTEFRKSLEVFLTVCREKGIEPYRSYSG